MNPEVALDELHSHEELSTQKAKVRNEAILMRNSASPNMLNEHPSNEMFKAPREPAKRAPGCLLVVLLVM